MPKHISRSPEWWEDVLATFSHIALDSTAAADAYLDAIEDLFVRLIEHPALGAPVPFQHPDVKGLRVIRLSAKFHKHLVFYVPKKNSIHVARILHSSRDIESLFLKV